MRRGRGRWARAPSSARARSPTVRRTAVQAKPSRKAGPATDAWPSCWSSKPLPTGRPGRRFSGRATGCELKCGTGAATRSSAPSNRKSSGMNLRSPPDRSASRLELESYLPYQLLTATNAVSRLIARAYEDRFGLTASQWRVVCVLAQDGAATADEVAQRLLADRAVIHRALGGLRRRRLADRLEGGGRRYALTQEGVRLHGEVAPLALAYEAALFAGLAPDEVK